MAYGGVPVIYFSANGEFFKNFCRIDGLTLDSYVATPPDIANADTGQITTAIPGVNQIGLPAQFGRGRGNWRPEDARAILDYFHLLAPTVAAPALVVPSTVENSPYVLDGDLYLTHQNIQNAGPGPIRAEILFLHTLIR